MLSKIIVLDTNVILHDPNSLTRFADAKTVIPIAVIEELDKFKKDNSELGRNARAAIRLIDGWRSKGSLKDGIIFENGSSLQIVLDHDHNINVLFEKISDNRILNVAYSLKKADTQVIFVSKDINARIKADAIGLEAHDFDQQKVNVDELYLGWKEILLEEEVFEVVSKDPEFSLPEITAYSNQYISFKNKANPRNGFLARYDSDSAKFVRLKEGKINIWGIGPKSIEQRIAIDLLLNPKINLVTLVGKAGTGKTLLALAAGLQQVITEKKYNRWIVTRPIMPLGKDIGYLPGRKDEKLSHWMEPIFDNLEYILDYHPANIRNMVYTMLKDGQIQLEALTYIRGRSLSKQYIIVDETQNLTPHEIKAVISRAGEDSKLVLTGDVYQIDNPYLDVFSNGLTHAVEHMKDVSMYGHVMLEKSERSKLADIAASRL